MRVARPKTVKKRAGRDRRPGRDAGDLRGRAEAVLGEAPEDLARLPVADLRTLVHELRVHQIELEIQNEELRRAQLELAESRDRYTALYEFAPVGYLTLDRSGKIREANLTASTLLALERRRLIGKRFSTLVLPEAQDTWHRHFGAVRASPVKQTCELALRRENDVPVWVRLETISTSPEEPAESAKAAPECRVVLVDVSERRRGEEELRTLNETLEQRVTERTVELRASNERLTAEIVQRRTVEEALRQSGERLRAVVETAGDGIITIDVRGLIDSVNPAAERLFGYSAGEMIGRNVSMLMPFPYREEHDGYLTRYLETGVKHIIGSGREVAGRRKDGSIFPIDLAVSEFRHAGPMFTGIVRDLTERKRLQRAVADSVVEEQQSIGRELHDGVAQQLTGVEMMVSVLEDRLRRRSAPEAEPLAALLAQLRLAQEQVRRVIRGLYRYTVPADGLETALHELLKSTESSHGLQCLLECSSPIRIPDANVATQLYYIAREAVHNAVRHARAKRITIGFEADEYRLLLTIRDDGRGIEPAGMRSGMGTQIMAYRAGLIGATLDIHRAPPRGTVVACMLRERPSRR